MKQVLSVLWGAKYTSWMYSKPSDHWHILTTKTRLVSWLERDYLPTVQTTSSPRPKPSKLYAQKIQHLKEPCNKFQKSRTTYASGSSSRRSSTLRASPSALTLLAHTSAHKPRTVWGHFTLHSPTSIFHLHNREGAAREEESPPWNN